MYLTPKTYVGRTPHRKKLGWVGLPWGVDVDPDRRGPWGGGSDSLTSFVPGASPYGVPWRSTLHPKPHLHRTDSGAERGNRRSRGCHRSWVVSVVGGHRS